MHLRSTYGDLGPNLKTDILEIVLGCRLFIRQLLAVSTNFVLGFTREDGNLCLLVDFTSPWTQRSPTVNSLSSSYDCSRPVQLKFNGEGNSWYANFVVRPNSLVSPIDSLMLTHTAYSVFGWKTLSANHLILSDLVVDPKFNVMSYIGKVQCAHLFYYLCRILCQYMKVVVYPSFVSCISHGDRFTTLFIVVTGSMKLGIITLSALWF